MSLTVARQYSQERIRSKLTREQIRDAKIARAIMLLKSFVKGAWKILEPGRPLVWGMHMDIICTLLERVSRGEVREAVINVPPRHTKSTLVSVCWPAWEWLTRPELRIINISGLDTVAKRDSRAMRKLINSKWYKSLQAYMKATKHKDYKVWTWAHDQNEKKNFENTLGGYRHCFTFNSDITGDGADRIIIDDPYDAKDVIGATDLVSRRMERAIDIYDNVLESRLNDVKTGARVTIMQRLHERDIPGYLLKKYVENGASNRPDFDYAVLPTEYDPTHPYLCEHDPRTEPGELLNPDRYPREWVDERANDPTRAVAWASQHGQRPNPAQGTKFKSHWFEHRYTIAPWIIVRQMDEVVISVDAAEKKGAKNDSTSITTWGRKGSKKYLLDRVNAKMEINDLIVAFKQQTIKWPLARVRLIEDKSNGTALIQYCKNVLHMTGIIAINPTMDKQTRAKFSEIAYEAGDIMLPLDEHLPGLGAFIAQHLSFPKGPHDDDIDSESQAVLYFEEGDDPLHEISELLNAFA